MAELTTNELERLRRKIGDKVKTQKDTVVAGEAQTEAKLTYGNVFGLTVTNMITGDLVADTGYELTDNGRVVFGSPMTENDEYLFEYNFAGYSDAELQDLYQENKEDFRSTIVGAILELMANSARLYDYSEGETDAKLSQVFDQLEKLLKVYTDDSNFTTPDGSKIGSVSLGKRISKYYSKPIKEPYDHSRADFL